MARSQHPKAQVSGPTRPRVLAWNLESSRSCAKLNCCGSLGVVDVSTVFKPIRMLAQSNSEGGRYR